MLYAQTGISAISAVNGCPGHAWDQRADKSDPHMSVNCAAHERHLKQPRDPLWAATPAEVPLTETEKRAADAAEAKASQVAAGAVAHLTALLGAASANPGALAVILQGAAQQAAAVPAAPEPEAAPAPAAPVKPARASRSRRAAAGV